MPLVAEAGGPMARRTFDVIDICEIFTHWHAGRSKNEIAGSLGLSRNTVRKYVAAAEAAGMIPGGPASQQEWAELARAWFPELQASVHSDLAESHHSAGQAMQARLHWQQALHLYTQLGAPEADQVRSQLSGLEAEAKR